MFKANVIVAILLAFVPLLFENCFPSGGSGMPCQQSKHEEQVGTVSIDSAFRIWLIPKSSSQVFKNSNGGVFSMTINAVYGGTYSQELKTIWATKDCQDDVVFTSKNEYDDISYSSPSLPYSFSVRRSLDLNYEDVLKYQDTIPPKSELVAFFIGNEEFSAYRLDTRNVYVEEYTLLDSTYKQVYVCNNSVVKSGLYPLRFMLQKGAGLIGFELSNKEVWAVKK